MQGYTNIKQLATNKFPIDERKHLVIVMVYTMEHVIRIFRIERRS